MALHDRGSEDVFEAGVGLLGGPDTASRVLGLMILRELGRSHDAGDARAFRDATIQLVRRRLPDDSDPEVVSWMFSVLQVPPNSGFRVAAALPYLATAGGKPKAVRGVTQLALDEDADIRRYALEGLRELGVPRAEIADLLQALTDDPGAQVRSWMPSWMPSWAAWVLAWW